MPRHNATYLILLACLLSLLTACRGHKAVTRADVPYPLVAEEMEVDSLLASLAGSYGDWEDLYVPVALVVDSPSQMSIGGRATLVRDKAVYLSLRALGMEMAQVYIDADSAYLVDKYHKMYIAEDLGTWMGACGLTVGNLQDLLLGRAFIPGGGTVSADAADSFLLLRNSDQWSMVPRMDYDGVRWFYTAWATDPAVLSSLTVGVSGAGTAECAYGNYAETAAGIVAALVTLTVPVSGTPLVAQLQWTLGDARWNTGREINFTPPAPDKYRRIDAAAIINNLATQQ